MKTFRTDEELLAARDAAFQQCRYESISAIVNSLAERKELDVVELDFPVRINEKVALVDKIGYVDGDSFRLYYSDSDFNGDDEHSAGNIGRLSEARILLSSVRAISRSRPYCRSRLLFFCVS